MITPAVVEGGGGPVNLPQTLHGQLFLLAYDRRRHRFDGDKRWCFGLALRAAMLSDLYLTGYLGDKDGRACPAAAASPDDPVLHAMLDEIRDEPGKSWTQVVARNSQSEAPRVVRSQLEAACWLSVQRCRRLGVIPAARLRLHDEDLVSRLADRVTTALRRAIAGDPADERALTVGLLGALGGLPTVVSLEEVSRHNWVLETLVSRSIPPITGMREAVYRVRQKIEADMESTRYGG